ncbi:uncharacterized protein DUF4133 [Dyadobacter jejuensis]|uniref:Uncharacterized protein DUF4133 n=1 Tax=Dyadobacter jejuensis TaxID=1082580 RepID=A0A316A669_9BACT|nr:uncharacterized protein DUF4133 [Dyadobacter jejuensis]
MITEVIKGADDEIEFLGFKGRYFYRLVQMVITLILITFITYALGFNSLWLFIIMFGIGLMAYFYIENEMHSNHKHGHIHRKHKAPKAIIQNKPFYKIIK